MKNRLATLRNPIPRNNVLALLAVLDRGKKVRVHWNFHLKTFSVAQGGLVIAHMDSLTLLNVNFRVQEAGRQRVIKEQKKNVHAFITGDFCTLPFNGRGESVSVRYNPYRQSQFQITIEGKGEAIYSADCVTLSRTNEQRADIVAHFSWADQDREA